MDCLWVDAKRVVALDIFRISLALLIFAFHSMIHFDCTYSFLSGFVRSGALAMTGFMLLSGYILTMTNYTKDILSP